MIQVSRPICLSIAGSDPSGGAGIQADLKTFSALGVYGTAALAGLTVQNTQGVRDARGVEPGFVVAQVAAVLDDLPVAATKIGMLADAASAAAVADLIAERRADVGVVVLDPVMVATSGDRLLSEDAVAVVRDRLVPLADLVTPNLPELGVLLDRAPARDAAELADQARALVAARARAVLAKGGHLDAEVLTDVLAGHAADVANTVVELTAPRVATANTHGTGCTLSSAITACAALHGDTPASGISRAAVEQGRDYLLGALRAAAGWQLNRTPGRGHGPVDHLWRLP